jgi:hypothetical protein
MPNRLFYQRDFAVDGLYLEKLHASGGLSSDNRMIDKNLVMQYRRPGLEVATTKFCGKLAEKSGQSQQSIFLSAKK